MPAPSKNWTEITDGQVDAESPLDTALFTAMRDDLVHLEEWLGVSYTAAKDHDHDGINSKSAVLADGAVVTNKLATGAVTGTKTSKAPASTGTYTIPAQGNWTPAAGVYQMVDTTTSSCQFEIYVGALWRRDWNAGAVSGIKYLDGANMRIFNSNNGIGAEVYYQAF